jgi:hypothetical protein
MVGDLEERQVARILDPAEEPVLLILRQASLLLDCATFPGSFAGGFLGTRISGHFSRFREFSSIHILFCWRRFWLDFRHIFSDSTALR